MAKDEEKDLRKVFERYEKLLFKAANSAQSETTYGYKAEFFKKVDEAAEAFKANARRFVDKDIPDAEFSPHAEEVLRRAGAFYDDFSSIVSQMQRTMTQVQLIFDKYTTPTAYGSTEVLSQLESGESALEIGKFWGIPEGGVVPGFLEPDLSKLQYYFEQLRFNIERIKELSEMGAAFNADSTVGNIAVETMKATYSSALKKAERLTTKNTDAIKRLFYLISQLGYDTVVPVEDISITWYDGLPNDEQKDIEAARAKVDGGLSCRKQEFVNRFNRTDEEFDDMWTQYLSEENDLNTVRAAGMFNPFTPQNGGTDGEKGNPEREPEEETDEPTAGKSAPEGEADDGNKE